MKFIRLNAGGKAEVIELADRRTIDYMTMKEYLGIDSPVTVVERKIGDKYYDFWLDDEGLLKPENERIVAGVLVDDATEFLVGNMLILKHDREGNSIGLTSKEIENILRPEHIVDMDSFNQFRGKGKDEDYVIYGYFDGGRCTIKAHSNWLIYQL